MSIVTLEFPGDHPITLMGQQLSGYPRPLSGEAASLTITVDHAEVWPEWLSNPPLGAACTVRYGDDAILDGVLSGVRVNAESINVQVAG